MMQTVLGVTVDWVVRLGIFGLVLAFFQILSKTILEGVVQRVYADGKT